MYEYVSVRIHKHIGIGHNSRNATRHANMELVEKFVQKVGDGSVRVIFSLSCFYVGCPPIYIFGGGVWVMM